MLDGLLFKGFLGVVTEPDDFVEGLFDLEGTGIFDFGLDALLVLSGGFPAGEPRPVGGFGEVELLGEVLV